MKCKRRFLKIGILCLMPLLALLLTISYTHAWYIDDNDNMTSSNLFDKSIVNVGYGLDNSTGEYVVLDTNFYSASSTYTLVNSGVSMSKNEGLSVYFYDINKQFISYASKTTYNFSSPNNAYYMRYEIITSSDNIMLNYGSSVLPYEPYGFSYINPNNIDFMQYLLGNNYFSHGRVMAYQTSDGKYWDRKLYPSNSLNNAQITDETINQYISGNVLNVGSLCTDLLGDLSTKSNYSTSNPTFIALKPSLAINGTATWPPVECRYIDLYIYCPNSLAVASCVIGGISDIDTSNHQRVEFRKQGDYIHVYFDDDNYNYLWDIDMRIDYSNGWVVPQNARCDMENNPNFNMYDLGVESGYQKGLVEGKQKGYGEGRSYGYNEGYGTGYNVGYNEGASQNFETTGFRTLLTSILSYPVNLIRNSLNFEFMGVNIANIVMFIVSLGIVAFVIKEFKD